METRLTNLLLNVGKVMQDRLAVNDFDTVTFLSPLLSKLQQIQKQQTTMSRELDEVEETLKSVNSTGLNGSHRPTVLNEVDHSTTGARRRERRTLRITIDWRANGRDKDTETIKDYNAARAMTSAFRRVVDELGPEAMQKLARVRVGRGPLLTRDPQVDFKMPNGKLYGHMPFPTSDYFILTHSDNEQKVRDIEQICHRVLGLKAGSISIEQISPLDDLYD